MSMDSLELWILGRIFPLTTLIIYFFTDNSSDFQTPTSPEKEAETDQERPIDLIAADDPVDLKVTTENLSDTGIPEMQDNSSEPSLSATVTKEEEMSMPAATDN